MVAPVVWVALLSAVVIAREMISPHKSKKLEIECDIFQGRWVFDDHNFPLYTPKTCPFISGKLFDCQNNGRPDDDYIKYKWKPRSCKLPRFDGEIFLKRFQGKRIVFVGDSVGYNQWLSLVCILNAAVPQPKDALLTKGDLSTLTFPAYNSTVMFYRNDFLVDVDGGDKNERFRKLDSFDQLENIGGLDFKDADVLVFNAWNEWLQTGKKKSWDVLEEANKIDPLVAYEKAWNTWAKWVNSNVDTNKTQIFLIGVSPEHLNSRDWADSNAKNCRRQTRPVLGHKYPGGSHPAEAVLEKAMAKVNKPVRLVNVTVMSQLRKDGHPSIYGGETKDVDCTHWCLPGLPDTWNQLLYASLLGYES